MRKLLYILFLLTLAANAQDSVVDCFGTNVTEIASWIGDGYCDDGQYSYNGMPVYFDCPEFNYDEGDCPVPIDTVPGCNDTLALNFVPEANFNDGSCEFPLFGCTNSQAINYNPLAEADNGTCANVACDDGEAKMLLQITLDQYPGETGWILTDISTGQPVESVQAGEYTYNQANTTIPYQLCVPESGVELILSDTYGDGMAGSIYNGGADGNFVILADLEPCGSPDTIWSMPEANFGDAVYSGPIWLDACEIPLIPGCMNPGYLEYNPEAQLNLPIECQTLKVFGCTDSTMFNYAPEANSMALVPVCDYTITIQDDAADGWGDSYLAVFHGEQQWVYTLGPGIEEQSWDIQLQSNMPVNVYYFEVKSPQQPIEEVQFQTMHNSFKIESFDGIELLDGGTNPFEDNGLGALQAFEPPFWNVYTAMPYCGNICEEIVYGCIYPTNQANTDIVMFNYDSLANTYDPSIIACEVVLYGCTDSTLYGYNYMNPANTDDGSCMPWFIGCMDEIAWNYQSLANLNDPESCLYFGCMDSLADNYNPIANVELEGACFTTVFGCTDPEAFNYNEEANTEDFSCTPFIYGCMDSTAFNYNSLANTEDECETIVEDCMDVAAYNYNEFANTAGECLYDAGCVGGAGNPFWLNDTCYAWVILVDPYCCNNEWDEKCQELYWSCSWDSPLDTRDLLRGHEIVMYPNPMGDVINILTNGSVRVEVYDITGKLVIKVKEKQTIKGLNQLNVSLLPSGIYNFSVTYNGNTSTTKVLKK